MPGDFRCDRGDYTRVLSTLHTRLRAHRAPGIPCALYFIGRTFLQNLGRLAPRDRGVVFELGQRHCEERLVRRGSTSEGGSDEAIHSSFVAPWIASLALAMTVSTRATTQPSSSAKADDPVFRSLSDGAATYWIVRSSRTMTARCGVKRSNPPFVIPGWYEGPDLRCAIAHRGISRFRARCFASPRNDGVWLASRSLSSGARSCDPLARNDDKATPA